MVDFIIIVLSRNPRERSKGDYYANTLSFGQVAPADGHWRALLQDSVKPILKVAAVLTFLWLNYRMTKDVFDGTRVEDFLYQHLNRLAAKKPRKNVYLVTGFSDRLQ